VDLPIPANDDAIRSIKLIMGKLADAIYEGRHGKAIAEEKYDEFDSSLEETEAEQEEDDDSLPGEEE
jgi:small subunit ribosomal protein S2